jgi:hypothetical protein
MVTELQYVAIVGYLTWGLISSLSTVLRPNEDEAGLVRHPSVSG